MTDIAELFEKLSLEDNVENLINEFSDLSVKCINDEKEIDTIIDNFDKLPINKQQKCIEIISKTNNSSIKMFLQKIGHILINRHNKKCYIEKIYSNTHFINC